ncbi:biotin--[acetyl-CoA-carboxylase] ligase [Faucicola boevrei]|uniref:biotin--[acetyl-CoA-carboxylase] ligase n=1 Tax=Faucicola boevrei TaxID=346665 RepID=UPI00036FD8A6|nr:biotin--[acetyl-CoA-carboxylase] ligase [Moraxella boevrei]
MPIIHTHFDCIDSTNTALINAVSLDNLPYNLPHLYTADHQTAGRGQHGRTWVSGADNVFLSLYVPIGDSEFHLHQLSGLLSLIVGFKLANLPIIQTINQSREPFKKIGIKWANDIGFFEFIKSMDNSFNKQIFKKIAGILIEPVFKKMTDKKKMIGVVIGVGMNINHAPKIEDGLYQSACINNFLENKLTAKDFYVPITNHLLTAVQICNHCTDKQYRTNFINEFNANHLLTDKMIDIFIQNNMTDIHASGECVGIGDNGELLLKIDDIITPMLAGMAKLSMN